MPSAVALYGLSGLTPVIANERPSVPPTMAATALSQAPQIDGNVAGDSAWEGAIPAAGLWQTRPNEGAASTQQTRIYVGYTDDALYIGVIAYDDEPDAIVVTDSRRDSELGDTDAFLVIIDGLLDRQNGYLFGTNAAGMEYDAQITREGSGNFGGGAGSFNVNWDGNWRVESRISEIGWSTEMEIPFKTLRYGADDEQTWGINFQRNIRRNNEVAFWSPLERNRDISRVSEAGTISGVRPPKQRNLKFTPYALAQAQRGGELDSTETDSEFGFDVKYSLTPRLTLDATYNTDFAQVEADDVQINLDRFNLFFPEKRPFFLENAGQFNVGNAQEVELFFSRRIGISDDGDVLPIDGGVRLSGKVLERTNIGFLYMRTDGVDGIAPANNFTVARVNQELPNRSSIGFIAIDRNGDGSHLLSNDEDENQTYGIDGRWGIGDYVILRGWAAKTDTPTLTGRDNAFGVAGNWSSAAWSAGLNYTEVGEDFNPEVGFLQRDDYRKARAFLLRRIRPENLWGLLEIRPHVSYQGFWNFDGFQETGFLHMDSHWEFQTGTELHTGFNVRRDGVTEPFDIIDGVTIQPGTYDHNEVQLVYFTDQSQPLNFALNATIGGRFGGDRMFIEPTVQYRIGERFRSELSFIFNDFDLPVPNGDFTANLARLRMSYSFTPKMLLQALVQYNEVADVLATNLRFSWLNSANSGLFVVYNEVDERGIGALPKGREFIVKYSYIFDIL